MSGEQRATPREKLALAVKLSDGSVAVTDNLSASGLCLCLQEHQAVADEVTFQLQLPDPALTFTADAKVVRREVRNGEICVAVRFVTARLIPED